MRFTQKLFDLVWGHKITWVWFWLINHTKVVKVELSQKLFWFTKKISETHKVYFDLYNKTNYSQEFVWYANIEKDWIDLWYKKRNEIKKMIMKEFKSEYVVGNYRNSFEK